MPTIAHDRALYAYKSHDTTLYGITSIIDHSKVFSFIKYLNFNFEFPKV